MGRLGATKRRILSFAERPSADGIDVAGGEDAPSIGTAEGIVAVGSDRRARDS